MNIRFSQLFLPYKLNLAILQNSPGFIYLPKHSLQSLKQSNIIIFIFYITNYKRQRSKKQIFSIC
ncbi:hypothetical protein pb186bvf_005300 [Paramecium bursaria]